MVQGHIFYSGMVQGIGFRYTTHRIARSLHLLGWVRNLPDGRVEILAEGPRDAIDRLTDDLHDHFGSYIKEKKISFTATDPQGQFKDFQIIG